MATASLAVPFPAVPAPSSAALTPSPSPQPGPTPVPETALGTQLFPYLATLTDPRARRGRRYALPTLLVLCVAGLCCECKGYLSIARWARALSADLQQAFGLAPGRTPCAATLLAVFRSLDWDACADQLRQWAAAACLPKTADPTGPEETTPQWAAFAVDGKALRASLAAGADVAHVVSLVAHGLGVSVADVGVAAKHGELTVAPELLAAGLQPGRVITGDALYTQRDLCAQICAAGGHYVLPVKGNQPTLLAAVQAVLGPVSRRVADQQQRQVVRTVEQGHGRIENRILVLATPPPGTVEWPGVAQVFCLERQRYRPARPGRAPEASRELVYGITSLAATEAGAATVLQLQRGHWSVENQVHWVLDTFFREDERRVLDGQVARGLAALRRSALNLLRQLAGRSIPERADRVKANPRLLFERLGLPTDN